MCFYTDTSTFLCTCKNTNVKHFSCLTGQVTHTQTHTYIHTVHIIHQISVPALCTGPWGFGPIESSGKHFVHVSYGLAYQVYHRAKKKKKEDVIVDWNLYLIFIYFYF